MPMTHQLLIDIGWPLVVAATVLMTLGRLFRQPGKRFLDPVMDPVPSAVLRWPGTHLWSIGMALAVVGWILMLVGFIARLLR